MTPKDHPVPLFFVAALIVSGLSTSRAEENCLAAPNSRAPQGSHWYYPTDPTSRNKCWHLRQTDEPPIQQQKPEQARTPTAAPLPLPRPAPNGLRQRTNSAPTNQAASGASVGTVDPAVPQSSAELRGGLSGDVALPSPPAATTNTNVWGDHTVSAPAPSSASSDNAPVRPTAQLPAIAEKNAGTETSLDEKPNAGQKQQRLAGDNPQPANEATADNEASYGLSSPALLSMIVAGVIVVGIFIRALVRMGFARRGDIAVEEPSVDLPAEAEKIQTSEGALRGLLQILEYEHYKAHRSATPTNDRYSSA
jgi:hypothetical protein